MTPFERDLVAHQPYLERLARKFTDRGDVVEDIVQTALLRALSARESFIPGTNMKAWLTVILRNEYFTHFRKRRREVEDPDGVIVSQVVDESSADYEEREEARNLMAELDRLPPLDKALLLDFADGLEYEKMAVRYRIAVGTVKSRIFRARGKPQKTAVMA